MQVTLCDRCGNRANDRHCGTIKLNELGTINHKRYEMCGECMETVVQVIEGILAAVPVGEALGLTEPKEGE